GLVAHGWCGATRRRRASGGTSFRGTARCPCRGRAACTACERNGPYRPMPYVDGFLLPLPLKNLAAYRRMAKSAGKIWREHGALEYRECVGEDLGTKMGVPFPKQMGTKRAETVVFAWIVYKSRKDRDRVN